MHNRNMKNDYRIGALVHSELVADITRHETAKAGWDVSIVVTSYENALLDAKKLFDQSIEAILCHGGYREAVFKKFGRRVIFIERSEIDLVKALSRARDLSNRIGLTAHISEARDIEFMEGLMGIKIYPIRFETPEELNIKIIDAMNMGIKVFVGGGGSARMSAAWAEALFLTSLSP